MSKILVGRVPWDGELPGYVVNRKVWDDYDRKVQFMKILLVNLSSLLNLHFWAHPGANATDTQKFAQDAIDTMRGCSGNWGPSSNLG